MQSLTLVLFAALVTVAYAGGQFYVPRAYYTIDSDGHESAPVPLRRLRRSVMSYPPPLPYTSSANSIPISTNMDGQGPYGQGEPRSYGTVGRQPYLLPLPSNLDGVGATNPNQRNPFVTIIKSGPGLSGRSVSTNTVVDDVDSSGHGV